MGISVRDSEAEAKKFVADNGFTFANGRDPDLRIVRAYGVEATPTTFLITRDGHILARRGGAFREEELKGSLQQLLDHKGP